MHFLRAKCYRASHASSGVVLPFRLGVCLAAFLEAELYQLGQEFFCPFFLIHVADKTYTV